MFVVRPRTSLLIRQEVFLLDAHAVHVLLNSTWLGKGTLLCVAIFVDVEEKSRFPASLGTCLAYIPPRWPSFAAKLPR